MFFVKNFRFTLEQGLQLTNTADLNTYIVPKIEHFSKYENYSSKEEKLKLLDEVSQMCDHDKSTATFDYSALPTIEGTNMADMQSQMIDFYNLTCILGGVFLNVFDKDKNRVSRVVDGISGAISTNAMFGHAYDELIACKNAGCVPAYGATLIFATLFEKDIKEHTKRIYAKKYITLLKNEISAGRITLTSSENNLLDFLQYQYEMISHRATSVHFDSVAASTQMQYDLYKKYGIISHNDSNIEKLLCNKFTLNQLIQSSLFQDIADDRFVKTISLLFGVSNQNLRNNLAHCNFTYANYYSIQITALLFILFTMVADESFLK